jgi:hypothetical protein
VRNGVWSSPLWHLGHVHKDGFPDMPVDVLEAATVHEAVVLFRTDVRFAAAHACGVRHGVNGLRTVAAYRQHDFTFATRVDNGFPRQWR